MTETEAKRMTDNLMAAVEWKRLHWEEQPDELLPYATHEGILCLGEHRLKVFQLSNGQRVIDAEDMERFFGVRE